MLNCGRDLSPGAPASSTWCLGNQRATNLSVALRAVCGRPRSQQRAARQQGRGAPSAAPGAPGRALSASSPRMKRDGRGSNTPGGAPPSLPAAALSCCAFYAARELAGGGHGQAPSHIWDTGVGTRSEMTTDGAVTHRGARGRGGSRAAHQRKQTTRRERQPVPPAPRRKPPSAATHAPLEAEQDAPETPVIPSTVEHLLAVFGGKP